MRFMNEFSIHNRKQTDSESPRTAARAYWLHVQDRTPGTSGQLALLLGSIVAWLFVFGFLAALLYTLTWSGFPSGWLLGLSLVAACAGPALWMLFLEHERDEAYRLNHVARITRLQRIAHHTAGKLRLPHRVLELHLRTGSRRKRDLNTVLRCLPPGAAAVVYNRRVRPPYRPKGHDAFFEPIQLITQRGELVDAAQRLLTEEDAVSTATPLAPQPSRSVRRIAWDRLIAVGTIAFFAISLSWFMSMLFGELGPIGLLLGLTIFSPITLSPLIFRRDVFVVPRAVLIRRSFPWQRSATIDVYSVDTSRLLVDLRTDSMRLADQTGASEFQLDPRCAWILLAAWISRARPPTIDELQACFGAEAEFVRAGARSPGPGSP